MFATIKSVMSGAGSEVKSKVARKDADVEEASLSSFARFGSEGPSADGGAGRFRESSPPLASSAFRFFSSAEALSMRTPWTPRIS
jgi:hypothetical protein